MRADETRQAAMQALWTYAQNNPDDPLIEEIYLLCGSVGEANDDPIGQRALVAAVSLAPADTDAWRMLSRSYRRTNQAGEAQAAAEVSVAIEAQNQGRTEEAEQRLQQALPELTAPELRAPVAAQLGEIAVERGDYNAASARFSEAYSSRERLVQLQPNTASAQMIDADAQRLVQALDRSGRPREACERLRQAQEAHDVAAPDQEILDRCQRILAVPLRTRVELAPTLRVRPDVVQRQQQPAPTP
jgi:tetratricopeptide (TPR) repeat protein